MPSQLNCLWPHCYCTAQYCFTGKDHKCSDPQLCWVNSSLPHRRFFGSSCFVPPHKCLLNWGQHSFPTLSQSRCTFQILESWPCPQGNPITTRSAWDFENPSWPLINIRLRAAKVRFTQSHFRIFHVLHNLSEGKKRRKKVTLGSCSGSRFYTIKSL